MMRFIELVPSTSVWEENLVLVQSLLARYGRQQILGVDEDSYDLNDLNNLMKGISDRLHSESAFSNQNEEYGV